MALEPQRYKGVANKGRVELEFGANIPDGAEVVVLFEPNEAPDIDRKAARRRLLAAMKRGFNLGGGPYEKRSEIYGDTGRPR